MDKKTQPRTWYWLVVILGILLVQELWFPGVRPKMISYSEFQRYLEQGLFEEISIGGQKIHGVLAQPFEGGGKHVVTTRVDPLLADELAQFDVEFSGVVENHFVSNILSWILPALFFVGIWMFVIRRVAKEQGGMGGFMTIGKSKAKVYVEQQTGVSFEDVAGVGEAKAELQEVVSFLKEPERYTRLGAHVPKGILLLGPPGTGKTLLARAVAGEAQVPFFSINGSEFVEMFVGVGAARVRDLFDQARQQAPCIVFIDELDALGRARGISPAGGGHDEKEQTLNQLLVELDGFDPSARVILLAATNRPEILDPALLRPGRFDRQVLLDRPDKIGRIAILQVHMKKIQVASGTDTERVASMTPGFTGADIANLVNEAALVATRRQAEAVTIDDFTSAIERIVAGLEKKNRLLNPKERRVVATHEMGHALVAMALPGMDTVHKVSIIPRGISALGYTIQRPTEDRYLMTRLELENKMAVLMGGRAAEMLVFSVLSTGAADDLGKATEIARSMVTRYGMDEKLGQIAYEEQRNLFLQGTAPMIAEPRRFSEETAREIDCAERELVDHAFKKATEILARYRNQLEEGARQLLEKETLSESDLSAIQLESLQEATASEMTIPEGRGSQA